MKAIKAWVKRTPWALAAYRRISWPVTVMMDQWATRYWRRTSEVKTPLGFTLISGLHPAYTQMRLGTFERDETAAILQVLPETDVFVDVGANLGYYSLLARQHGKDVVAFEPQPHNLQCLYRNLAANGWQEGTEIFPIALAAEPGVMTLYGASGPSASLVKDWAGYSPRHQQSVPVSTLDRMLAGRYDGQRLLIKIDVEGAEHGVLLGSVATLGRTPRPAWLVEICLDEYHPGGNQHFGEIFELFWRHGYTAHLANGRAVTPGDVTEWVKAGRTAGEGFNYLFL